MPLNRGIADRKLTRTLAGKDLSPWLLKLMSDRALPLAPRSLIHVTMPPLAFYIQQRLDYLRKKGGRLVRRVTDYIGLNLPQATRLPILLPASIPILGRPTILSPMWQRLLDLVWFRQHRRQMNEPLQRITIVDERQFADEFLQTLHAPEEKRRVTVADEAHSIGIKNLRSLFLGSMGLPDTTDHLFHQTHAPSVHLQDKQRAGEPETNDTGRYAAPHISRSKIFSIYPANQIQEPNHLYVKDGLAQTNQQPQPTYQKRWLDRIWTPLAQSLVLHRMSRARAELGSQAAQHPTLPYIDNTAKVITQGEETIKPVESYHWPVNLEKGNTLPNSLPAQGEPTRLGTAPKRRSQSTILKAVSSSKKLGFNSLTLNEKLVSGLLFTRAALRRVPGISQAKWTVPRVKSRPEIAGQRAETTNLSEDSGSMTHSPVIITVAKRDNVSLGQSGQTGQTKIPLVRREPPSVAGLHRQPPPITENIYQMASLLPQYFKSVGNASPDRSGNYIFPQYHKYEPSSLRYKDTRQPTLEPLFAPIVEPRTGSDATYGGGLLPAIFEGTAQYASQPTSELALAPVGRPTEAVSSPLPKAEIEAEEITKEAVAPDIDTIARDVYSILKRRLKRERERALGLS